MINPYRSVLKGPEVPRVFAATMNVTRALAGRGALLRAPRSAQA